MICIFHQAETGALMDKISEMIVGELVKVLDAAKGTKSSMLDLNNKLLDTTRNVLKGMEPELKELRSLGGGSADQVAKDLTLKINQNRALRNALPSGGKKAHRIIGPLETGMNHILKDFLDITKIY